MDSSNYSVEVTARSGGSSYGIGPAARLAASSAVTCYGYVIFGGDAAYLVEITAGAETILGTGSDITANTNYTLRLEVDGSTIRCYLNGALDIEVTDASLNSGGPGIMGYGGNNANTYITTWTAIDLATGTTYNQSAAGSMTPSGANVRRTNKAMSGALSLAGASVRAARKSVAGVLAPAGATVRRTAKSVAGALGLAGALSAVRLVLASVGGALSLAGALARQTNITTAGTLALSGAVARSIAKSLAGALGLAGALVRALFGPSASKLDVTLSDAAQTALTIGDAAQTALTIVNAAQTALTIGDAAV